MNRTTLIALAGFVVLLAVVLIVRHMPAEQDEATLSVPGWAPADTEAAPPDSDAETAEGEATAAKPAAKKTSPIDEIEITREGTTIRLVREGTTDKDWKITAPVAASAEEYRVRRILQAFEEPREAIHSTTVAEVDLPVFKLDPKNAIRVKLNQEGTVFTELVIGGAEKSGEGMPDYDPNASDTWVQRPDQPGRAYRLAGVDLRTPLEIELSDIRSKRVLDIDRDKVSRIVVENPTAALHRRIVLVKEESEGAETEGTPAGKKVTWRIDEPKGYRAGPIGAFLGAVAGVYVTDFLAGDDEDALQGLSKDVVKLTLIADGQEVVLEVGAPDDEAGYLRVGGRDELYKVSKFTANNLRKTLGDLRDKKVFPFAADAVAAVTLENESGEVVLRRAGGRWVATKPAGLDAGTKPIEAFIREVAGLTVSDFLGDVPVSESGLDDPTRKLQVEAAGAVRTVLLGAEKEGKVYATVVGDGEVFTLSGFMAKRLDKTADDFRDMRVLRLVPADVSGIELHAQGAEKPVVLARTADGAWASSSPEDRPKLKEGPVSGLVTALASLEAKAVVTGEHADTTGLGDDAYRVVVRTADGSERTLWIGGDAEAGQVYARTDAKPWAGKTLAVMKAQADRLRKTLADLPADK